MPIDQFITLSDQRKLAFLEYGEPNGYPIFALHGLPGSRIWFMDNDPISTELGIRLITVDRPGFGLSDPHAHSSFHQFANDLKTLVLELSIERFSVLGVSGGGVFAAAVAHQLPEMVRKAGVISTVAEFNNGKPPKTMAFANRSFFRMSKLAPWLLRFFLNQQKKVLEHRSADYIESSQKGNQHLSPSDQEIMKDPEIAESMFIHLKEAYRQGVEAAIHEAQLFCNPWDFRPEEIQVPVEIWHGTDDTLAPVHGARQLSKQIPSCNAHFLDGFGHFLSEDDANWKSILQSLI